MSLRKPVGILRAAQAGGQYLFGSPPAAKRSFVREAALAVITGCFSSSAMNRTAPGHWASIDTPMLRSIKYQCQGPVRPDLFKDPLDRAGCTFRTGRSGKCEQSPIPFGRKTHASSRRIAVDESPLERWSVRAWRGGNW